MNKRLLLSMSIVVFLGGSAYLVACGGDDSTGGGTTDGGADATAYDAPSGDDASGDDGSTVDSGKSDAGKDAAMSDATSDAMADAGIDATIVADGGPIVDAAPGGDGAALSCGSAACSVPSQSCCFYQGEGPGFVVGCSNGAQCPLPDAGPDASDGGVTVTSVNCEQNANCPSNNVCCLERDLTANTIRSTCKLNCTSSANLHTAYLCDPGSADAGCSVDAGACSSTNIGTWGLPNGYGTCGGKSSN